MFTYQVADGFDSEGSYADLAPQPYCERVQYGRRADVLSGAVYSDAAYADLVHAGGGNEGITDAEMSALLTSYGVTMITSNDITITLPGDDRTADNWNGTVFLLSGRFYKGLWRDVVFRVKLVGLT